MSTDIVIATVSVDSERKFSATVEETLYGTLGHGERLESLPGLSRFQPISNGDRLILFLERHKQSPSVSVVSAGVYLLESDESVHEYRQRDNPTLTFWTNFGPMSDCRRRCRVLRM